MATPKFSPLPPLRSAQSTLHVNTDEARELVRQCLDRILGSPVFRNSRRYSSVLKFVVETTLDGAPEELKERTIGVAVFGRQADYDTTADHVVRSAVAEIRKRLAQYYQEEGGEDDVRIELLPGSYVPQFRLLNGRDPANIADPGPELAPPPPATALEEIALAPVTQPSRRLRWPRVNLKVAVIGCIAAIIVAVLATLMLMAWRHTHEPLVQFWQPLLGSQNPIVLCVGDLEGSRHSPAPEEPKPLLMKNFHSLYTQNVHLADAVTLARIAGFLDARGAQYRMISQSEATYTDLQSSPTVLIGLLNNDWTKRLVSKMRFTIDQSIAERVFIRDRNAPARNDWSYDSLTPYLELTRDYAIVLRTVDPKTDEMVVVVGGLSVFGTLAAAEFVTTAHGMSKLQAVAPSNWGRKNFELVLSTDVIRGKPGHASIVATYFW
jgi:hypothetical protein